MKITDLKLNETVQIDGTDYRYKGIQKISTRLGKVQKIVFEAKLENRYDYHYLNLNEGHKELKTINGKMILK